MAYVIAAFISCHGRFGETSFLEVSSSCPVCYTSEYLPAGEDTFCGEETQGLANDAVVADLEAMVR